MSEEQTPKSAISKERSTLLIVVGFLVLVANPILRWFTDPPWTYVGFVAIIVLALIIVVSNLFGFYGSKREGKPTAKGTED
ncbi:hypothetical protein [Serinicoccus sp. LYQ131]|uniref:hypothetical protein n=1 Tax=Serinicoccus sp. LYQ131 TaxID=3378797 RepID=UPI003851BD4D